MNSPTKNKIMFAITLTICITFFCSVIVICVTSILKNDADVVAKVVDAVREKL